LIVPQSRQRRDEGEKRRITAAEYVRQKTTRAHADDPLEELRRGWDRHVAFGLANPAVYALIYGDPTAATAASASRDGYAILYGLVARAAEAGRLRVSIPHAARLIAAAGEGVTPPRTSSGSRPPVICLWRRS